MSFEENEYEAMEGDTANVTVTVDGFFTVPFNVTVMPGDETAIGSALWFALCVHLCL